MEGVEIIHVNQHLDARGFFCERYRGSNFVQENWSYSHPGVIRGMHAQEGQSKLVGIITGKILDVIVDGREDSKTFGQKLEVILSPSDLIKVPAGCFHGFQVIGDEGVHMIYKVDRYYNPEKEYSINIYDDDLKINWIYNKDTHILSEKDKKNQTWKKWTTYLK